MYHVYVYSENNPNAIVTTIINQYQHMVMLNFKTISAGFNQREPTPLWARISMTCIIKNPAPIRCHGREMRGLFQEE